MARRLYTYGDGNRHPVSGGVGKVHPIIHNEDGTVSIPTWQRTPNHESLIAHARLRVKAGGDDFTDIEEEAQRVLSPGNLVLFRRALRDVAAAKKTGRFKPDPVTLRKRAPKVERLAEVRELRAAGMVPKAIADALGLSDQRVGKLLEEVDGGLDSAA
jgi:hypothetical protein